MKELLAALIPAFQADLTLSAVAGPWLDNVPASVSTLPTAVFSIVGQKTRLTFEATTFQDVDLRFTIRDDDLADLQDYARALEDLLIKKQLDLATAGVFCNSIRQLSRTDGAYPSTSASDGTVYFTAQTYRFETQRELP